MLGVTGAENPLSQSLVVSVDASALVREIAEAVAARLRDERFASESPWMDVDAAARHLGCSPQRVRKLVQRRGIPFHQERRGARIFFSRPELDRWLCSK